MLPADDPAIEKKDGKSIKYTCCASVQGLVQNGISSILPKEEVPPQVPHALLGVEMPWYICLRFCSLCVGNISVYNKHSFKRLSSESRTTIGCAYSMTSNRESESWHSSVLLFHVVTGVSGAASSGVLRAASLAHQTDAIRRGRLRTAP